MITDAGGKQPVLLSAVMVVNGWLEQASDIVTRVAGVLDTTVTDYEIILVDNTSGEHDDGVYRSLTAVDGQPNVQVYRLLRPVDYEVAAWAGIENSLGDLVIVLDPFSDSLQMIRRAIEMMIEKHTDLILIVNETPRPEMFLKALLRHSYLGLFRLLGGINLQIEASQFRIMSKRVVSYLLQQARPASRYRALPATAGFSKAILRYTAPRRPDHGAGFWTDTRRAVRLLMSNSTAPPRIASVISLTCAGLNALYSLYVVILALTREDLQPGWATLSLQQSGMFFLFSMLAFVLTEYLIDNVRSEVSGTSYFVVDEFSSAVLTRRQRLNVETQGAPPEPMNEMSAASVVIGG